MSSEQLEKPEKTLDQWIDYMTDWQYENDFLIFLYEYKPKLLQKLREDYEAGAETWVKEITQ